MTRLTLDMLALPIALAGCTPSPRALPACWTEGQLPFNSTVSGRVLIFDKPGLPQSASDPHVVLISTLGCEGGVDAELARGVEIAALSSNGTGPGFYSFHIVAADIVATVVPNRGAHPPYDKPGDPCPRAFTISRIGNVWHEGRPAYITPQTWADGLETAREIQKGSATSGANTRLFDVLKRDQRLPLTIPFALSLSKGACPQAHRPVRCGLRQAQPERRA